MAEDMDDGPEIPQRFASYEVVRSMGTGGMGEVYLAKSGSRFVVIKRIRPELASQPSYRARFAAEARAAKALNGAFVARLFDYDADADQPWLAMEYVEGSTLKQRIQDGGPMDGETIQAFARDLADALLFLHDNGVVHGDLTHTNVMLEERGRLKIIDLGLALPDSEEATTGEVRVLGTMGWMAPEVAAGERPDHRSDTYQWARLVVYAATGRPTTDASAVNVLPPRLAAVVAGALRTNPALRPTGQELWNATRLRDADSSDAGSSGADSSGAAAVAVVAPRPRARRRLPIAALAAAAAVLLIAVIQPRLSSGDRPKFADAPGTTIGGLGSVDQGPDSRSDGGQSPTGSSTLPDQSSTPPPSASSAGPVGGRGSGVAGSTGVVTTPRSTAPSSTATTGAPVQQIGVGPGPTTTTTAQPVTKPTPPPSTTAPPPTTHVLYDWNGQRSHTRNGSDLVVGVGPHGWVMQPFVFNYKLLDHITFVAGCGGCSVDVHIYTDANGNNSAGEGCIVRSLPVNENAFTTAQFSACALTKNVYYYAQIFNLRADGPLAVYLVDDSGGSQNDFAYATGGTIPPSTAVRCTIVASE